MALEHIWRQFLGRVWKAIGKIMRALVIGMLSGKRGVTLDALAEATGWLPHTTRAALTGLRKRGYSIERSRTDGGESVYRIDDASASTAA